MKFLRPNKSVILAATLLLTASFSIAATQTEEHEKPVRHKAHPATHHAAPKAGHHDSPKTLHPEIPKTAHHSSKKTTKKKRVRGQQAIDGERARQIQEALVREHYMTGQPSGDWDANTQAAMRRYQADQGWQSKTVPDSRALIHLGLGPDHGHLLNPESAMTTEPQLPHGNATARTAAVSSVGANSSSSIQPVQSSSPISSPAVDVSPAR